MPTGECRSDAAARFQRATRLFNQARRKSREERDAWVEAACHPDEALRRDVLSLLAQHERIRDAARRQP